MAKEIVLRNTDDLKDELSKVLAQREYMHLNDKAVQEAFEYAAAVRREMLEARRILERITKK